MALPGCPRAKLGCGTEPGREHCRDRSGTGELQPRSSPETFPSSTAPLPGRALTPPEPGSAHSRGTHLILLLGQFPGGFGAEDCRLARWGRLCLFPSAPLAALSLSGDLRACVRLCVCASGAVWHFPCRSRLPVPAADPHIQAGRQADLPASQPSSRPPLPPLRPGLPCAPAFSRVFVFPNLQSFV